METYIICITYLIYRKIAAFLLRTEFWKFVTQIYHYFIDVIISLQI